MYSPSYNTVACKFIVSKFSQVSYYPTVSQVCSQVWLWIVEAIVRGYITGSAWKEYTEKGTVHGMKLTGPNGHELIESEKLEKPIYTPCKFFWDCHLRHVSKGHDWLMAANNLIQPRKRKPGQMMRTFIQIVVSEGRRTSSNLLATYLTSSSSETCTAADIVGLKYAKRIEELSLEIYEKVYFASVWIMISIATWLPWLLIGSCLCHHLRNHHSRHEVRVWSWREHWWDRADRRGFDSGQQPFLVGEHV